MDADHLAQHDRATLGLVTRLFRQLDRLPVLALERHRRFLDPRRLHKAAGLGRQASELHLVDAVGHHRGGDVHLFAHLRGHHVDHELAGLLGVHAAVLGRRVAVGAGDGEVDHGREFADAVVEAVGGEIDPALAVDGGDPADGPRHDQRLQRILRQSVVALGGIVEHRTFPLGRNAQAERLCDEASGLSSRRVQPMFTPCHAP